jgi:hypothetical protein
MARFWKHGESLAFKPQKNRFASLGAQAFEFDSQNHLLICLGFILIRWNAGNPPEAGSPVEGQGRFSMG